MTQRKIRKDILIKNLETKFGIPNTITNPTGRNARSDKKLDTLQKEINKQKNK